MTSAKTTFAQPKRERREFGRRKICKPAEIVVDAKNRMPCTLVDLSQSGVGLRVAEVSTVPEIHRTGGVIGAQFLSAPRKASRIGSASAREAQRAMRTILKTEGSDSDKQS
jgi:hypothetical protein